MAYWAHPFFIKGNLSLSCIGCSYCEDFKFLFLGGLFNFRQKTRTYSTILPMWYNRNVLNFKITFIITQKTKCSYNFLLNNC